MEYLDEVINVRIRPSDKQKLTALALSDNLSVSAYCRSRLLNELKQSS
jgi:predicted HicB family RNase H-like nuclease